MGQRYKAHDGAETRFQPGSNGEVLENLPGIANKVQMDQLEYEALVEVQERYAETVLTENTRVTAELICQMHRDWLGNIYEWAGNYRTVNLSKNDFTWPPYGFIKSSMRDLEVGNLTRYTPCRAEDVATLATQLAKVHAEFLLIHPFRDGNGRLARWIADIMAMQAGFPIPDYEFTGSDAQLKKNAYISAVVAGYREDFVPLTTFFAEALERGLTLG